MKNLFVATLLFVCLAHDSVSQTNYRTTEQRKQFYTKLAAAYSGEGVKEIFKTDTRNEFDAYVRGNTEQNLVESYSTVIHELLHGYNVSAIEGNYYFIEPGIRILVPLTEVYRSKELNVYVRKGVQDSVFRYGIYIGARSTLPGHSKKVKGLNDREENETSSIQQGIYGLLEEFNAYYYGCQAAYELYGYYKKKYGEVSEAEWKDYKHSVLNDALAYYEFNLFFGWYMVYAKENYPRVYKDIMNNKPFRVVYTLLQKKFAELVKKVNETVAVINSKHKPDMMDLLDFSGSEADVLRFLEAAGLTKDQLSMLSKNDLDDLKGQYHEVLKQLKGTMENEITLFHAQPVRQIAYIGKQLTPAMKNELDLMMINELTTTNYKTYLK